MPPHMVARLSLMLSWHGRCCYNGSSRHSLGPLPQAAAAATDHQTGLVPARKTLLAVLLPLQQHLWPPLVAAAAATGHHTVTAVIPSRRHCCQEQSTQLLAAMQRWFLHHLPSQAFTHHSHTPLQGHHQHYRHHHQHYHHHHQHQPQQQPHQAQAVTPGSTPAVLWPQTG